jgi:pSer/pThr/pTyr-binding forkhead associated (FHA) protein
MAKLILRYEGNAIGEFELDKEQMIVGRRPENDVHIDNLAVSGRHAKIITILNDSFLEDMNSTNGTYVNGTLVKKHALQDGDTVTIGRHQLKFVNQATPVTSEYEKTVVIRTDVAGLQEAKATGAIAQSVAKISAAVQADSHTRGVPSQARLEILTGANYGKDLELTKSLTTIGKPGVQVAAITRRPQGYFIIHIDGSDSRRFPKVNGEKVGVQARPLRDRDIIEIAGTQMQFSAS